VDNDGNPLTVGDQYFNTVNNELRIYNGSAWQSAAVVGGTVANLTVNNDSYHYGVRVGRGGGAVSSNTVVGAGALAAGTSADYTTAVGYEAALSTTTATRVTAVGSQALRSNTTGRNTAAGWAALYSNTTGTTNTALGDAALYSNTTASGNTAAGYGALLLNTTGENNTALGVSALRANTTGANNTAVGYQAAFGVTTGIRNTFIGRQSGYGSSGALTGNFNVGVGEVTGINLTSGYSNTLLGSGAGYLLTTGSLNTFVGSNSDTYSSGQLMTTGSKNTFVGNFSGVGAGIDLRTLDKYVVLSDGDGYPALWGRGGDSGYMKLQAGRLEFPATQNPSSNANTLDDYEEGGFNPAANPIINCSNISIVSAIYVKVGREVTCEITGTFNVSASGTNTYFTINLPFSAQLSAGGCIGQGSYGASTNNHGLIIDNSSSTDYQYGFWVQGVNNTESGASKPFQLGMTYIAAA